MARKKTNYEKKGFVRQIAGTLFSPGKGGSSDSQSWRPRKNAFERLALEDEDSFSMSKSFSTESETGDYKREIVFNRKKETFKHGSGSGGGGGGTTRKRENLAPIALKPCARDSVNSRKCTDRRQGSGKTPVKKLKQQHVGGSKDPFKPVPFEESYDDGMSRTTGASSPAHTFATKQSTAFHTVCSDPTELFSQKSMTLTKQNLDTMQTSAPSGAMKGGIENVYPRSEFHQFTVDDEKASTVILSVGIPDDSSAAFDSASFQSLSCTSRGTRIQKKSSSPHVKSDIPSGSQNTKQDPFEFFPVIAEQKSTSFGEFPVLVDLGDEEQPIKHSEEEPPSSPRNRLKDDIPVGAQHAVEDPLKVFPSIPEQNTASFEDFPALGDFFFDEKQPTKQNEKKLVLEQPKPASEPRNYFPDLRTRLNHDTQTQPQPDGAADQKKRPEIADFKEKRSTFDSLVSAKEKSDLRQPLSLLDVERDSQHFLVKKEQKSGVDPEAMWTKSPARKFENKPDPAGESSIVRAKEVLQRQKDPVAKKDDRRDSIKDLIKGFEGGDQFSVKRSSFGSSQFQFQQPQAKENMRELAMTQDDGFGALSKTNHGVGVRFPRKDGSWLRATGETRRSSIISEAGSRASTVEGRVSQSSRIMYPRPTGRVGRLRDSGTFDLSGSASRLATSSKVVVLPSRCSEDSVSSRQQNNLGMISSLQQNQSAPNKMVRNLGTNDQSGGGSGSYKKPLGVPNNAIMASMLFRTHHTMDTNAVEAKLKAKEDEQTRFQRSLGDVPLSISAHDDALSTVSSFSHDTSATWRKPTRDLLALYSMPRRSEFNGKQYMKEQSKKAIDLFEA